MEATTTAAKEDLINNREALVVHSREEDLVVSKVDLINSREALVVSNREALEVNREVSRAATKVVDITRADRVDLEVEWVAHKVVWVAVWVAALEDGMMEEWVVDRADDGKGLQYRTS